MQRFQMGRFGKSEQILGYFLGGLPKVLTLGCSYSLLKR